MTKFHAFTLGRFQCKVLCDGENTMALGDLFPRVNSAELHTIATQHNFDTTVQTARDLLFIATGDHKVLIDSGLPTGPLAASMSAAGLDPAEIDVLVITHGDGDHIGGLANFPNARLILPHISWALWTNPKCRAQMLAEWELVLGSKLPEGRRSQMIKQRSSYGRDLLPSLQARIQLVKAEEEFLPGFKMVEAFGHRSDHFAVEIRSKGATLLHAVDAFRHPIQAIRPDWVEFYTSYPEQATQTITQLLDRAVTNDAQLFLSHMAFPGLTSVHQDETGSFSLQH